MSKAQRIKRNVIATALTGKDRERGDDGGNNKTALDIDAKVSGQTKSLPEKRIRRRVVSNVSLPGGRATLDSRREIGNSPTAGRNIGALPKNLTYHIRAYLDVLLGAVEMERLRLVRLECYQSDMALPNVVASVLQYNNIAFKSITLTNTQISLPEPVWYDIDLVNNHLHLYLYQPMYDSFCTRVSRLPVIVSSGVIKLEDYNPVATHPLTRDQLDTAAYNCAIVADHVAQHIISDVLQGDKKVPGADIHDRYNDVGTTLHSMLDITATGVKDSSRCAMDGSGNATSYFTLLGDLTPASGSTAAVDFPFTYAAI